ncbi:hypothetical protein MP638_002733 [Amoeboaphelidium occidentale]|nr:hypothetical protein MP638_002733 [Amoeboaphelidium occidentale]
MSGNEEHETEPLLQSRNGNVYAVSSSFLKFKKVLGRARTVSDTAQLLHPNLKESTWKQNLSFRIDTTFFGRYWEIGDTLLNILFCFVYIYNTRYFLYGSTTKFPFEYQLLDCIIASLLLLQFLPRLLIASDVRFAVSYLSVLTFISTIPVFLAMDYRQHHHCEKTYMCSGPYSLFYPLRFMRLHVALISLLEPSKTTFFKVSIITRKAIRLLGFLFCLIMALAAFVHLNVTLNEKVENISFFDAFYFAFLSSLSGSPSQIIPDSETNRALVVGVIITVLVFVPARLAELLGLISKKSKYEHSYKKKLNHNHIVVCGQFETASLQTFLKEFFCTDHGTSAVNTHIIILQPNEPSEELQNLLLDPMYVNRVQYIIGTVMNDRSLEKIRIHEAAACFVLSSKYVTEEAREEDAATVMRALALKKARNVPLHVQVLLPENKCHFEHLADTMMCVDELKLGMLAQSCRCPGFATLVNILTTTTTEATAKKLLNSVKGGQDWIREYLEGANQEIYPTLLSNKYKGIGFLKASQVIYEQFGVVLFGLGIPNMSYRVKKQRKTQYEQAQHTNFSHDEKITAADFDLFLNPGNYILQGYELAFVIGSKDDVIKQVSEFDMIGFLSQPPDNTKPFEVFIEVEDSISASKTKEKRKRLRNHRITDRRKGSVHVPFNTPDELRKKVKNLSNSKLRGSFLPKKGLVYPRKAFTDIPHTMSDGNLILPKDAVVGTSKGLPEDIMSDFANLNHGEEDEENENANVTSRRNTGDGSQSESGNIVSKILQQAMGTTDPAAGIFSNRFSKISSSSEDLSESKLNVKILPDDVVDHILVCDCSSNFPSNMEYFIAPLRFAPKAMQNSSSSVNEKDDDVRTTPIVILSPADPSDQQRVMLSKFSDIYVIKGNPMVRKDLSRAGVARCLKAVVLANTAKGKHNPERIADSPSLLTVLNIEAMTEKENLFVISEFIHEENIFFIGQSEIQFNKTVKERYDRALLRPAFMSGHVYAQSMLDTVICQNFFNPHMLNIIRHLLFSGSFKTESVQSSQDDIVRPNHSHIWLAQIPNALIGTCFIDMFGYIASVHKAIPIALYRRTQQKRSLLSPMSAHSPHYLKSRNVFSEVYNCDIDLNSHSDSFQEQDEHDHHYVYVNPAPDTVIQEHDRVFVLAMTKPDLAEH